MVAIPAVLTQGLLDVAGQEASRLLRRGVSDLYEDVKQSALLLMLEVAHRLKEAPSNWLGFMRVVARRRLRSLYVFRPDRPDERLRTRVNLDINFLEPNETPSTSPWRDVEDEVSYRQLYARWSRAMQRKSTRERWASNPVLEARRRYLLRRWYADNRRPFDV